MLDYMTNTICWIHIYNHSTIWISYIFHIISLHGKIWTPQIDLASNLWLHSSVGRASHRCREGHGFESRWSPDIFQASCFQLSKLENLLRLSLFTLSYIILGDSVMLNHVDHSDEEVRIFKNGWGGQEGPLCHTLCDQPNCYADTLMHFLYQNSRPRFSQATTLLSWTCQTRRKEWHRQLDRNRIHDVKNW